MAAEKPPLTAKQLARLLREAEQAHAAYESSLGHRDDDWPDWYARYIVGKLREKPSATAKQGGTTSPRTPARKPTA
ncbi:MAG TPA: hypothetical protein VFU88_06875 [Ktedonobacterales bacterium]|nr:hypothetical protein [Ktedonobacterales bacterium]